MKKLFRPIIVSAALLLASAGVQAQDLLAAQSPLDKQMAFVDSIALRDMLLNEANMFPADELYDEWSNDHVRFKAELPDSFCVDLRGFAMPTTNTKITDIFGYRPRRRRVHNGIDIKVYVGDTIRSAFDGKVRIVKNQGRRRGYGKYVVIRHNNGIETLYGHLSKWLVTEGQNVKAGQPIALGGNTGRSSGSHLHFETLLAGKNLNPALMFDFEKQDVTGDFYNFRRNRYAAESAQATRLRGVNGSSANQGDDDDSDMAVTTSRASIAPTAHFHKVKKGETLQSIARKCHTTVAALCKINRIGKTKRLMPGQILKYN